MNSNITPGQFRAQMESYLAVIDQLARHISQQQGKEIPHHQIKLALFERLADTENLVAPFELIKANLTFNKGLSVLKKFDFTQFDLELELDVTDWPIGILPDKFVSVKAAGEIFRIHLNDADHWPSKPHAHITGTNLKLDLSNGNIYARKVLKRQLPRKALLEVRAKFEKIAAFRGTLPALTV